MRAWSTSCPLTRTCSSAVSKAHSLAGFRVGYAILPPELADDLNENNDASPLVRPSEAAALATLQHEGFFAARRDQIGELRESMPMPLWLVQATWIEDEAERTEQWEVNAATPDEATREVLMLLSSRPRHVDVRPLSKEAAPDPGPGRATKLS